MRILFVHSGAESYVRRDLEIVRTDHEVREVEYRGLRDLPAIARGAHWCETALCWFGALHGFWTVLLARLLRRPTAIVAGGYDVARLPALEYGLTGNRWKAWCPRFVFRHADRVLAVSETSRRQAIENAGADPSRTVVVHHGFHPPVERLRASKDKLPLVLTVSSIARDRVRLKGLDRLTAVARLLPEIRFLVVGPWLDDTVSRLREEAPLNLRFTGEACEAELEGLYARAQVILQLSMHESFCCSLAEAMRHRCVPVVTRAGALPEVVGDCGIYVSGDDPEETAAAVREALRSDLGERARERILRIFSFEKRRSALLHELAIAGRRDSTLDESQVEGRMSCRGC
jgi:glycosyltransferase involved in cell wall biosynthesis